jgi:hypothetical protein
MMMPARLLVRGAFATAAIMQKLEALLDRLRARQRELILEAAGRHMLPPDGLLRKIAELENVIAAVEAVMDEAAGSGRGNGSL